MSKWPKQISKLSETERKVRDDWMRYWHERLLRKFGIVEKFNHGFPAGCQLSKQMVTLEMGAGLGEHISYEDLRHQEYLILELRENMAETIREKFPRVKTVIGDIQQRTCFADRQFDRIIVIHVLEHLLDLPSALREIKRLLKDDGLFQVVSYGYTEYMEAYI